MAIEIQPLIEVKEITVDRAPFDGKSGIKRDQNNIPIYVPEKKYLDSRILRMDGNVSGEKSRNTDLNLKRIRDISFSLDKKEKEFFPNAIKDVVNNRNHFEDSTRQTNKLFYLMEKKGIISPEERDALKIQAEAFHQLRDVGKYQSVRNEVRQYWNGYNAWIENGRQAVDLDSIDYKIYQYIDSLNQSQKKVLSGGDAHWNKRNGNWVIDHQIVSAIKTQQLIESGKISLEGIDDNPNVFVERILNHINPPKFMFGAVAENLGYKPQEIKELMSCGGPVFDSDGKVTGYKYHQPDSVDTTPMSDDPKRERSRLESIAKKCGFGDMLSLILNLNDCSQFGSKEGSLIKIIGDVCNEKNPYYWNKCDIKGELTAIPMSVQQAFNSVTQLKFVKGVITPSSYMEGEEYADSIGGVIKKIFLEITQEQYDVWRNIEKILQVANVPTQFGYDWIEHPVVSKVDGENQIIKVKAKTRREIKDQLSKSGLFFEDRSNSLNLLKSFLVDGKFPDSKDSNFWNEEYKNEYLLQDMEFFKEMMMQTNLIIGGNFANLEAFIDDGSPFDMNLSRAISNIRKGNSIDEGITSDFLDRLVGL